MREGDFDINSHRPCSHRANSFEISRDSLPLVVRMEPLSHYRPNFAALRRPGGTLLSKSPHLAACGESVAEQTDAGKAAIRKIYHRAAVTHLVQCRGVHSKLTAACSWRRLEGAPRSSQAIRALPEPPHPHPLMLGASGLRRSGSLFCALNSVQVRSGPQAKSMCS